ncbi:MAG: eL32 family ribosomal protein [Candidatus Micrarchaeaceae archaeon]
MAEKKHHPKFNVPNYGAKSRKRVKERWRKQRGIDNKKRIKKKFMGAEPTIGYRNAESLQGVRVDGLRLARVSNMGELRAIIENGSNVNIVLAKGISKRKKAELAKLASENKLHVVNVPHAPKV